MNELPKLPNLKDYKKHPKVPPFDKTPILPKYFGPYKRVPNYQDIKRGIYGMFLNGECQYVGKTINGVVKRLKQHSKKEWCKNLIDTGNLELRLLFDYEEIKDLFLSENARLHYLHAIENLYITAYQDRGEATYNRPQ